MTILVITKMGEQGISVICSSQDLDMELSNFICNETFPNNAKASDRTQVKYQKYIIVTVVFTYSLDTTKRADLYGFHLLITEKIKNIENMVVRLVEFLSRNGLHAISQDELKMLAFSILHHVDSASLLIHNEKIEILFDWNTDPIYGDNLLCR